MAGERCEFCDDCFGRERRPSLSDCVDNTPIALTVRDRERHRVRRSAGWIAKCRVMHALHRRQFKSAFDRALVDDFLRNEVLEIVTKLSEPLGWSRGRILCHSFVDFFSEL